MMNSKPSSSKSTSTASSSNTNVLSKLRRLKIEENMLIQSLQKLDTKIHQGFESVEPETVTIKDSDYKTTLKKLQDSYIHLRTLFDDVKTISSSQDLLAELDIDEIKSKVLELEKSLKQSTNYIDKELNLLRVEEQDIIQQMNEISVKDSVRRKRPKIPSGGNLNQVVPSPVRLLMTSPFKCSEVQDFQDFMKSSPNRYGGWIEYNHNLFVKYWHKYFGESENNISTSESYLALENFIEEVLMKIQGVDKSMLISHIEWYKKYLLLKNRQQKALDRWKSNRTCIKKVSKHVSNVNDFEKGERNDLIKNKPKRKVLDEDDISRLMKPTEQWISRNYDRSESDSKINHIEHVKSLRTPHWRLCL